MKRFLFIILITSVFNCKNKPAENIKLTGPVFGTAYNIQYFSEDGINYQAQIDSLFKVINQSLSTYIKDSDISRLNRNEGVEVDTHFARVYKASKSIFIATDGVFDPTIGNVVNAWNFGSENNKFLTDSTTIDSLMQFVGFDKVNLEAGRIIKPDPVYLEFNAIAKGYGIDVICEFLETNGIANFLVDIGGDLRVKGINIQRGAGWTVGIDDPNFDGTQSYSKVVVLKNEAMATSGTYRKYKQDEQGNRYAHIMDTRTGYPTKTNILSASVIAPDCMTADGYATAFQAMGIEEVKLFLRSYPELKVFFIYEDEDQTLNTLALNNFPE
ncbi:MAG: FAD:protein FMN transferase [Winogradskyella sp.]|uniref:FAD:protein FMN transferase n=1 Tax=Winogradskyella sp. TaxID=1883156 RepID=UPI00185B8E15|nr:FAD:protein FMN transferase [Winogradskyella sp.]